MDCQSVGRMVCLLNAKNGQSFYQNYRGSPTLTLLNVLKMLKDPSLACWALLSCFWSFFLLPFIHLTFVICHTFMEGMAIDKADSFVRSSKAFDPSKAVQPAVALFFVLAVFQRFFSPLTGDAGNADRTRLRTKKRTAGRFLSCKKRLSYK